MRKARPIKLNELLTLSGLSLQADKNPTVTGLSYDSRRLEKGDLFFAIRGANSDAHDYLPDVEKSGAVGAIVERVVPASIPLVKTASALEALSPIADAFYGKPSRSLPVIGITGTNGKTTITYIVENMFRKARKSCGVLGTINYRFKDQTWPAPNTTPMALDIHQFLNHLLIEKADALVMEVSSHALDLGRVADVHFQCGVFTNLTQDHLDYHKTMEAYFDAKAKLFEADRTDAAVINTDDPYGQKLVGRIKTTLTFGLNPKADVRASDLVCDLEGIRFNLTLPSGKTASIRSNLMGQHNVSNLLAAAGTGLTFGLSEDQVIRGLNQNHVIPGRLERVEGGEEFVVVVDYAHTPDALAKVLEVLKQVGPRRLVCVFGAGGDRDRRKRPLMGKWAGQLADDIIITSDNPRTEDPETIMKDVEAGVKEAKNDNYVMIENREKAIETALKKAQPKDIVLIAGKGHEDYQIYGKRKFHFSDQEVARRILS